MKSRRRPTASGPELAARLCRRARRTASRGCPRTAIRAPATRRWAREGWIGLHWPEELGGRGLDPLLTVAAEERFGYHWLPLSSYLLSVKTIGNALLDHASDELQERLLPEIAAGRLVFCQGFSEPEAGLGPRRRCARPRGATATASSSPATRSGPRARRSPTGSTWRCAPTRTRRGPHRGVSVLVAEMDSPGIEVREIEIVGGGVLSEVFLDDVEVPGGAARRRGERRLAGADEHARPRARDEREDRDRAAGARRPRGGARARRRAARAAAAARRGRGRPPAGPACR